MPDATTPERLKLLEAVAEAAEEMLHVALQGDLAASQVALDRLNGALIRLRVHDAAQPAQKTVEVRATVIFWDDDGHDWMVRGEAGWDDKEMQQEARSRGRPLAAILTARVPLPSAPTIAATVTLDREPGR